jgi:hypothetical protein
MEISLVREAAASGTVADSNVKKACDLFSKVDKTRNSQLLANPEFKEMRQTLEY